MKNEIMTFSPVDNELLLSEMDMMEVYGGTGEGGETNTYCAGAKCTCLGPMGVKCCWTYMFHSCGPNSGSGGQGSGSGGIGSGSGSGSGKGKGKGKGK